ncbi:MAG: hypothetical protein FJW34_04670 [Acidobacteria bacterium]|nr:hypothetical protein [Acidobacteriota bacterium]
MKRTCAVLVLIAALAPSAWVAWQARDMPQLGLFHDDSLYWVCAKSLAEGSGYRILSLPEQPHQTKYPPLYSLLLAAVWKVTPSFPDNLALATLMSWLWLPLCLLVGQPVLAGLGLGPTHRLVVTVLLALNPYVILYSVSLMSEVPFTCLLLGCLALTQRAEQPGGPRWVAAAAGAAGGVAFLMRTAALPLLVTAPLVLWRRKQRPAALWFVAAMLPAVGAWGLWARAHQVRTGDPVLMYYTDYLGYQKASFSWSDAPLVIWTNLAGILEGSGSLLMVFGEGIPAMVVGAVALLGVIRLARRGGLSQYPVYAAACVLMLLTWHLGLRDRYLRLVLPLAPLAVAGLTDVWRWLAVLARTWLGRGGWRLAAAGLVALVMAVPALLGGANTAAMLLQFPAYWERQRAAREDARPALTWLAQNAPPEAAILAEQDPMVYLYTGRRGYRFIVPPQLLYRGRPEEIARFYREVGAYARRRGVSLILAVGEPGREQVGDPLGDFSAAASSPDLELLRLWPRAALYRVRGEGS